MQTSQESYKDISLSPSSADRIAVFVGELNGNIKLIEKGIKRRTANAVLIKINQIGTLTETLKAIELSQFCGIEFLRIMIS